MNPELELKEQLEAQSREAIIACLNDPSVQLEYTSKDFAAWMPVSPYGFFNIRDYYYRIAKPRKFYRVCEFGDGSLVLINKEPLEKQVESSLGFVRWLDERKYYE